MIFDDTIQEKKWTDENKIMCWHFDHTVGKSVRGINMLNALYYSNDISIPVFFEIIKKPIIFSDIKTKKVKRKSEITKNELMRQMIQTAVNNRLKFRYVLMDTWFSAKENFEFIAALKSNRQFATTLENKYKVNFQRVDELDFSVINLYEAILKNMTKKF